MGFTEQSLEWCCGWPCGRVEAVAAVNETPSLLGGEVAEKREGFRALTTGPLSRKVSELLPSGLVTRLVSGLPPRLARGDQRNSDTLLGKLHNTYKNANY